MQIMGVDVSKWNGDIDWNTVKNTDVEFAIIRTGYGSPSPKQIDPKFQQNANGCQSAGIPFGAYHYGYALSEEEARTEARFCLDILNGIKCDYPVFYDIEEKSMFDKGVEALTNIANAFCEVISEAGYKAGVYMSKYYATNNIDMTRVPYEKWIAQYNSSISYTATDYGIWQYTSDGNVSGIGTRVDLNWCYKDYVNSQPATGGNENAASSPILYIGECMTGLLNVRSGPGVNHPVKFNVARGNEVQILELMNNGWIRIFCLHGEGYCNARYINWPVQGWGSCNAAGLNIRRGGGVEFDVNYVIGYGTVVNILGGLSNGWIYVDTPKGRGYCNGKYISQGQIL